MVSQQCYALDFHFLKPVYHDKNMHNLAHWFCNFQQRLLILANNLQYLFPLSEQVFYGQSICRLTKREAVHLLRREFVAKETVMERQRFLKVNQKNLLEDEDTSP